MKKILFFTPSLNLGGVERVFLTYAEELISYGYDVTYLTTHDDGVFSKGLNKELKLVSLKGRRFRYSINQLIKYLKNKSPDIVITGGDIPNAVLLIIVKLFGIKTKLIISQHNFHNIERSEIISRIIIKYLYNYATKVIAVSNGIKEMLLESGVKNEKIVTLYNPVNIKEIVIKGSEKLNTDITSNYIVYVGRLGEVKNLEFLIEAFNLVQKINSRIHLVIVGDGPLKKQLINKSQDLNLNNKIHFLGEQSNPYPYINKSLLVILSSFSEALPTIILESFVFSKTVVSTPTNGAIDLMENGRLGYISNSFSSYIDFADTIEKALLNPIPEQLFMEKIIYFDISFQVKKLVKLF
jgi:glycosyltransferase involved in cell wall biosynthesis